MAKAKNLLFAHTTGKTVYAVITREEDGAVLDQEDGTFKANLAACADPYCHLTEDAAIKGRYRYKTAESAWPDGRYYVTFYEQAAVAPDLAADTVVGSADMYLVGDASAPAVTPSAGDLCTVAQVKAALNVTNATKDTLLSELATAASQWIARYCDRILTATEHTEYFSPGSRRDWRVNRDRTRIAPRQYPLISVSELAEDANREFIGAAIDPGSYWLEEMVVNLYQGGEVASFAPGERTVKLVYTAGYTAIPADLQRAAIMLTAHLYYQNDKQRLGVQSQSLGDQTITYLDEDMPKVVKAILDPAYRRPMGL